MNFLSLDIGTTCCKSQVFSAAGEILRYRAREYSFLEKDGERYADMGRIVANMREMIAEAAKEYEISSVCISTFGESFVLLGEKDEILFDPMLYTDPRGEKEAEELLQAFGAEKLFSVTGTVPQSMYSLSKLLWIKNNRPEVFARAEKCMLICDYLGYLLTGKRVIDYALASRTGAFDIEKLQFSEEILGKCGISAGLFSAPAPAGSIVGELRQEVKNSLGIVGSCQLVLGSHDQICSALGAGAVSAGDAVDGMGTVECITPLFAGRPADVSMGREGYVCVPYAVPGLYCTYMLNYSCGSIVNWYRKDLLHGYHGDAENIYTYLEKSDDSPSGILLLPYFGGAATPYQNINAKGAFLNLTAAAKDSDLYKAIMEGAAMEMRLNAERCRKYGIRIRRIVATGGGANSKKWLSLKASVQKVPVRTLRSSEGGLCGCAILQAAAMGAAKDLPEAARIFVRYKEEFLPDAKRSEAYEGQYKKYKKLYRKLKEFF